MSLGAGRLGFRYNRPPDRGYKKNVLVFYDPLTDGPGGNTNYYNTSQDLKPATDIYPVIQARASFLGSTITLVESYADLNNLDLFQFSQIWDIGYASPYLSNPSDPTNKLYGYLQSGGAMFILGENSNFGVRDDAVDIFVTGIGGGNIVRSSTQYSYSAEVTVQPEFLLSNASNSIVFGRPGTFSSLGSGTAITTAFASSEYVAAMWKTGSLSGAPSGAIVSVLDINFFVGFNQNLPFIDNLILSLNRK
jgi:hypothetical protein